MSPAGHQDPQHVTRVVTFCRQAFEACGFAGPDDLDAVKVAAYVQDLKQRRPVPQRETRKWKAAATKKNRPGLSFEAINGRLTALKAFSAWMARTERIRTDPLKQVAKLNARTDPHHRRRALTDDELARLIKQAENGPDVLGMSGPDRAMLYRVAVGTGLRRSELASLTPGSFDLADTSAASVTVEAAYSKHREQDVQPLPVDLAVRLKAYTKGRPRAACVWKIPAKTAHLMRTDGEAAEIPYRDGAGRVADFHALRHTFITRLARAGVMPATCMKLARHKTVALTMKFYTHMLVSDERAALGRVPEIGEAGTKKRKATGTDDARP